MLDLSDLAGSDVRFRWKVRLDDNDDGGNGDGLFIDDIHVFTVLAGNHLPGKWSSPTSRTCNSGRDLFHTTK